MGFLDPDFAGRSYIRPRFDAPGRPSRIEQDALPGETNRGGKPENLSTPPAPPAGTGTKYPTDYLGLGDIGSAIKRVPKIAADVLEGVTGLGDPGSQSGAPTARSQSQIEQDLRAAKVPLVSPEEAAEIRASTSGVPPLAKEAPGTLHYRIGQGDWQSRAPGAPTTGGDEFASTRGRGLGREWKPVEGGGGFMQSDIRSLPRNQWPESLRAEAEWTESSPIGIAREHSRLQQQVEEDRRKEYYDKANAAADVRMKFLQHASTLSDPKDRAATTKAVEDDYKQRMLNLDKAFNIGERLAPSSLYHEGFGG